jgi:hypothetical protein
VCCLVGALHHCLPDQSERLVSSSLFCCCAQSAGTVGLGAAALIKMRFRSTSVAHCRTDMVLHLFTDGLETREVR